MLRIFQRTLPVQPLKYVRFGSTLEDMLNNAKQNRAVPEPKKIERVVADAKSPSQLARTQKRVGYVQAPIDPKVLSNAAYEIPSLETNLPGFTDADTTITNTLSYPTKITTLPNGVRVITKELHQISKKIGTYIHSGPCTEPENMFGVSQMYDRLIFKGTENRSEENLLHSMETLGGAVSTMTEKDHFGVSVETTADHIDEYMQIFWECFSQPRYSSDSMHESLDSLMADIEKFHANPGDLAVEASLQAAFGKTGLGSSVYLSPEDLTKIDVADVNEYRRQSLVGSRVIVAGLSVDHDYLVRKASETYGRLPKSVSNTTLKTKYPYIGGDVVYPFPDMDSHFVAVSYPCPAWSEQDIYTAVTWQMLLGGGSSFSSGGPGKGMLSRLYRKVLNQYYFVDSIFARVSAYRNAGLFTLYGSVKDAQYLPHLAGIVLEQLADMITSVADEEIDRAKAQLASTLFINLEHRRILLDDLAKQLMYFDRYIEADELLDNVNRVTKSDMIAFARKMVQMNPSIALLGDVDSAPSPKQIRDELINLSRKARFLKQ